MRVLKEFVTEYKKTGKHRKKCWICGSLIEDGSCTHARLIEISKCYPIKGVLSFQQWKFAHEQCWNEWTEEER